MTPIDIKVRQRLSRSNIAFLVLWVLNIALIFAHGPFWIVLSVGLVGSYLALCDRSVIRTLTKESIIPPHPDADVQALIDGKIDIAEYRLRKEKGDAV
jgi:hypothetical protein